MSWNHRLLAHEHKGEMFFQIHEVYYSDVGKPDGYSTNAVTVGGEDVKSITWTLNKMKECLKNPILWAGDKFPSEYEQENK